uniref:Uncharacterized protein n=1 Tax=Lepeophtheirus salmonis TaxID=72036 RepID=A0A0K2UAI1_LEPSM
MKHFRLSKSNNAENQKYAVDDLFQTIPCSFYSNFVDVLFTKIIREKSVLPCKYYNYISGIFNRHLRELSLSDCNLFQDSSSVLEEFLTSSNQPVSNCKSLKIYKNVMALLDFDPLKLTHTLSSYFPNISVMIVQGLPSELDRWEVLNFIKKLVANSPFIQCLDLSGSNIDDKTCEIIGSSLNALHTLQLNNCLLTSAGVSNLLKNKNLVRLDCLRGIENLVRMVITSSDFKNQVVGLRHFILRNKKDIQFIDTVAKICPDIQEIKLHLNIDEMGFATKSHTIDEILMSIHVLFKHVKLDLNATFFNAFQFIQLKRLSIYGPLISRIRLIQVEYLHAISLEPLGKHCNNLKSISIYDPTVIGDEMFFEGVPSIDYDSGILYFPSLNELTYEGSTFDEKIGQLFFIHSQIEYCCLKITQNLSKNCLQTLIPKNALKKMILNIKCGLNDKERLDSFTNELNKLILTSKKMTKMQLYIKDKSVLEYINNMVRSNIIKHNWDLDFYSC